MISQIKVSAGVNANYVIKARTKHLKGPLDIEDKKKRSDNDSTYNGNQFNKG